MAVTASRNAADGDLVIANDKWEMNREKEHIAYLYFKDEEKFASVYHKVHGKNR